MLSNGVAPSDSMPAATANGAVCASSANELHEDNDSTISKEPLRESFEETPFWCAVSWAFYLIVGYTRMFMTKIGWDFEEQPVVEVRCRPRPVHVHGVGHQLST